MAERIVPSLSVAISPCPNDTFIFGAWVLGQCPSVLPTTTTFIWEDVQELNEAAVRGEHDVIKVSAAQALHLLDSYALLPAGGAFSRIYGPKLVTASSRRAGGRAQDRPRTIAVPGMRTTAVAILRQAWSHPVQLIPVRYDQIIDMVLHGQVDAGLLIHESALLLDKYGLTCLLDLGQWWDAHTAGLPLPLGCILGLHSLGPQLLDQITLQIQASLNHASHSPHTVWPLIQALAQELDDTVLQAHIRTYVNHYSRDMGDEGRRAMDRLRVATEAGKLRS